MYTATRRAMTLIETLFLVALSATLALMTMRALGLAREVRGKARERAALAMLAQAELDRLSAADNLAAGTREECVVASDLRTTMTVTIAARSERFADVTVSCRPSGPEAGQPVVLATIMEARR